MKERKIKNVNIVLVAGQKYIRRTLVNVIYKNIIFKIMLKFCIEFKRWII